MIELNGQLVSLENIQWVEKSTATTPVYKYDTEISGTKYGYLDKEEHSGFTILIHYFLGDDTILLYELSEDRDADYQKLKERLLEKSKAEEWEYREVDGVGVWENKYLDTKLADIHLYSGVVSLSEWFLKRALNKKLED